MDRHHFHVKYWIDAAAAAAMETFPEPDTSIELFSSLNC